MSQTKVKSGLLNFPDQTDFVKLPSGTTAQRPSSPEEGYSRYNTTDDKLEYWNGTLWQQLPALDPPTLTSVDYPGNDLAADPAGGQTILINGTNFVSGISVEIGSTQVSSVTLNSTTQLAITSPALTAGDYDVTVTNLDTTTITALDFISYNGVPSWVTASGSLGSLNFGEAILTISLSATEPDGGNVSYAITSGALPTGLSLSSSGDITGTMPSGSAETTYSFTVTATDDENQSTDRSFTITGVVPFVNSKNFNTVLYTGQNPSYPNITGVGFTPDLVWIKNRDSSGENHSTTDVVSGFGKILYPNLSNAQGGSDDYLMSQITDGFSVNTDNQNGSGVDYVAWCWKAGGTPVSNENGTITSQVSANTEAGFSIVSWTGNNLANATIGHGLEDTPKVTIIKKRTSNVYALGWQINLDSSITGSEGYLNFDTAVMYTTFPNYYTSANSTVLSTNGTSSTERQYNNQLENYIAYCFAEVEGFSNFGSYVGTGVVGNVSVVTGFEPAMIIVKRTDAGSSNWFIWDNKRDTTNPNGTFLLPNAPNAEANLDAYGINFLENGFTVNSSDPQLNASGGSYIYMAFAADPNTQVPTKADSFNTVLWTGENQNVNRSISGVGFQPDLVWAKVRTYGSWNHQIYDSVRGAGANKAIHSNGTGAEGSGNEDQYGYLSSFDIDGFTGSVGTSTNEYFNTSLGYDMVAWAWKAGGTPYINTDGSITSVVSANPAAGFSIVSYTGNGTSVATIGHGLYTEPSMIICKSRSGSTGWLVYHKEIGNTDYLILNTTDAKAPAVAAWNNTTPTSSVFTIGAGSFVNTASSTQIAYCFAEVAGFSKFGSYTGTRANGNVVVTGFEPAFVMMKSSSTATNGYWVIMDNKRSPSNPRDNELFPNDGVAEYEGNRNINFLSNGFELTSSSYNNDNGTTYIYMAFANQF